MLISKYQTQYCNSSFSSSSEFAFFRKISGEVPAGQTSSILSWFYNSMSKNSYSILLIVYSFIAYYAASCLSFAATWILSSSSWENNFFTSGTFLISNLLLLYLILVLNSLVSVDKLLICDGVLPDDSYTSVDSSSLSNIDSNFYIQKDTSGTKSLLCKYFGYSVILLVFLGVIKFECIFGPTLQLEVFLTGLGIVFYSNPWSYRNCYSML